MRDASPVFSVRHPGSDMVRREIRFIALILLVWALGSFGFIIVLWAIGTKGPPVLPLDAHGWENRFNIDPAALPGESWLTRIDIIGFPLHWLWTGMVLLALFIGLAVYFNVRVDALRRDAASGAADAGPGREIGRL